MGQAKIKNFTPKRKPKGTYLYFEEGKMEQIRETSRQILEDYSKIKEIVRPFLSSLPQNKQEEWNNMDTLLGFVRDVKEGLDILHDYDTLNPLPPERQGEIPESELAEIEEMLSEGDQMLKILEEVRPSVKEYLEELTQIAEPIRKQYLKFSRQEPETRPDTSSLFAELEKVSKETPTNQIQVSKDLWYTQIHSSGDTLELIKDEQAKEQIRKLQKKGKLLNGTLEGLSGGTAYFKVFTIALAQTLNEQSKYYKTEEDRTGVPKQLLSELAKGQVEIKEGAVIKGENRKYPYILVSYEDQVKRIRGTVSGGKDIEEYREYLDTFKDKVYLLDLGDSYGGVPFVVKEFTIYNKTNGKEVGCILRLSPQFSKTINGYTGLRSDTLQLLGGGKQKDITLRLLDYLLYVKGTPPKKGYKQGEYAVDKSDILLPQIATNKSYEGRPSLLEKDFKLAVQKMKDIKILCSGANGYREEKTPSGKVWSVFKFNPNYLKGEPMQIEES